MHDTALEFGKKFFSTYVNETRELLIIDIGSQDVNGSLRPLAPLHSKYIGIDFVSGKSVDIIINDLIHFHLRTTPWMFVFAHHALST